MKWEKVFKTAKLKNKKIIADLMQLTELLLKPSKDISQALTDSKMKINIKNGTGIFLNKEEAKLFDKIIIGLLAEQLSEYASEKFLKDSLWNYVHEIHENPDDFQKNMKKKVQNFFDGLVRPFVDWIVVFPLDDLKCQFDLQPIGSVKFFTFTESKMKQWRLFQIERLGRVVPYFKEKLCAQVIVKANDSTKAIEKGKFEVDTALNLIRSYHGVRGPRAAIEIIDPLNAIAKNLDTGAEDLRLESDWSWGSTIEAKDEKKLSSYIQSFDPILKKTQKTRLDKRIVRSINWCGEATKDKNPEDKVLKYFTALECLLVPKGEGLKGEILGERVSILWTSKKDTRELIKEDIIDLYEKRSNIIHGSEYEISEKDITKLDFVTKNLIAHTSEIICKNKIGKMDQLINWIGSQR